MVIYKEKNINGEDDERNEKNKYRKISTHKSSKIEEINNLMNEKEKMN